MWKVVSKVCPRSFCFVLVHWAVLSLHDLTGLLLMPSHEVGRLPVLHFKRCIHCPLHLCRALDITWGVTAETTLQLNSNRLENLWYCNLHK